MNTTRYAVGYQAGNRIVLLCQLPDGSIYWSSNNHARAVPFTSETNALDYINEHRYTADVVEIQTTCRVVKEV